MIELFAALLLQNAALEADCRLTADLQSGRRSNRVRSLTVDCAAHDDPALQAAAEQIVSQIDLDFWFGSNVLIAGQVWFEQNESGDWQALPGQFVIYSNLQIPVRLVESGYRQLSCAYAAHPDRRGRLADPETLCFIHEFSEPDFLIREANRDLLHDLERSRMLPTAIDYCFEDEVHITASVMVVTQFSVEPEEEEDYPELDIVSLCDAED
ncbi:MAG: hypothetical protein GC188_12405 [Alphaproteobacteria bacterium]|nr:hypothetical protein [Alphaproteobacteria bacterium]